MAGAHAGRRSRLSPTRADVVVIGAGPAGCVAAYQLATRGVDVLLVDRATFPRDKVCGESASPGAVARLREIGMWEPDTRRGASSTNTLENGMPIQGMRIRSPRGTSFLGRYRRNGNGPGVAIRRTALDTGLLAKARDRGVRIMEGVEAHRSEIARDGEAVVHLRDARGRATFEVTAKRAIVADGRRSFIARALGFINDHESGRGPKRFAVRAHCEAVSGLTDLAEMHVGHRGYCGIAPLSSTTANVCYVEFGDRLEMTPRTLSRDFWRDLGRYPEIAERLCSARVQGEIRVVGPLCLTSNRQTRGPFIACGDTSGFLDPFTGEGIAHAIASGVLGADAVTRSVNGDADAFRGYERQLRSLRRVKGTAARMLHALVARPRLADAAATLFARVPHLADHAVQLFGDQI